MSLKQTNASESTPLLNHSRGHHTVVTTTTGTTNENMSLSVLPTTSCAPVSTVTNGAHATSDNASSGNARNGKQRRSLRRNRRGENEPDMDTSNGSRNSSTTTSNRSIVHEQIQKFNQSFRELSFRVIQYVEHHTGTKQKKHNTYGFIRFARRIMFSFDDTNSS
jgi:hypothetical protein